jgi:hypothetical protein
VDRVELCLRVVFFLALVAVDDRETILYEAFFFEFAFEVFFFRVVVAPRDVLVLVILSSVLGVLIALSVLLSRSNILNLLDVFRRACDRMVGAV